MIEIHQFKTDVDKLNRRITVERSLDDFLKQCVKNGVGLEARLETTQELLKRYMSVIRSRNQIRRNWHPLQALECDSFTLELITKDEFKKSAEKLLQDALVVATNGSRVIVEDAIKKLSQDLADEAYKRKQKKHKPTPLEKIVSRIYRSNPEVTNTDVINEMRSNQREYSIVNMDEKYVEIEVSLGSGKDSKIIRRSLRSIGKILTNLKNP